LEHERIAGLRAHVARIMAENHAFTTKDLEVDGRVLMAAFGRAPGPWIGRTLEALLERVLDDPSLNERGRLVGLARELDAAESARVATGATGATGSQA
jgi:hypothetical protein